VYRKAMADHIPEWLISASYKRGVAKLQRDLGLRRPALLDQVMSLRHKLVDVVVVQTVQITSAYRP
jgi:hypothetical protein